MRAFSTAFAAALPFAISSLRRSRSSLPSRTMNFLLATTAPLVGCNRQGTNQCSRTIATDQFRWCKPLEHLKPKQREIVRSISLNGSSIRETADRLQMTEGAVRVTLHRALKALAVFYRS